MFLLHERSQSGCIQPPKTEGKTEHNSHNRNTDQRYQRQPQCDGRKRSERIEKEKPGEKQSQDQNQPAQGPHQSLSADLPAKVGKASVKAWGYGFRWHNIPSNTVLGNQVGANLHVGITKL
jgi:hypothetical protein